MSTITSPTLGPRASRERLLHWAPLAVLLGGTFMSVLDFFIVNVALPRMQSSLHASPSALEWVTAGYALSTAVLLIAAARLGDRYGRRAMFCVGMTLFTIASAVCTVAPDATTLILGRLAQGIGGALLSTNVLSLIGVLYTSEDRPRALGAYATVMGFAAVSGQLIGGALVQLDPLGLSWRSCFLINLPIGVAALAAARRLVPESRGAALSGRRPGIDAPGITLITAGLTAIVLPLVEGRQLGWPTWTWISLGISPLLLIAFVVQQRAAERRGATPLLMLALFAQRAFRAGMLAQTVFWCGQGSFFLILALYLQHGRGLSPLSAGLVFTALALPYVVASMQAPQLALRHGRNVITLAAATLVAGHLILIGTVALTGTHDTVLTLLPGLMVVGVGMGFGIAPLTAGLLASLRPEQAGAASGALATAQFVGSALGIALVGLAFFGALHAGYDVALEHGLAVLVVALTIVGGLSRLLPATTGQEGEGR
jgi:EmrB/QacA subfamily drug resistance transporter